MAPGNEETRAALQHPEIRPPCLRDPIPLDILNAAPVEPLVLDAEDFARNMRSAKRGAAGCPSGMTADHLRLILESELDTRAFCRAAQDHAIAQVPPDVVAAIRIRRITALQKPGGSVRFAETVFGQSFLASPFLAIVFWALPICAKTNGQSIFVQN